MTSIANSNGLHEEYSSVDKDASLSEPTCHDAVVAAVEAPTSSGDAATGELSSTSFSVPPPPGYRLVTVRIKGWETAAVEDLPVEVLPCHTFADLCALALARVPDAPQEYGIQAFLVVGPLEVPLNDPHAPARDALRSFAAAAGLRFRLDPDAVTGGGGGGGARVVRVTRMAPSRRRQRLWLPRLAKVAVGIAKLVLAVEAAALLRGGLRDTLGRLTARGGRGANDEYGGRGGDGMGSETEAVLDAVADYVSGRGDLLALERFDPQSIRGALEAMDTEVLEQLDVPDVNATRAAVREVLRQIGQEDDVAAATTSAAAQSTGPIREVSPGDVEPGPGPSPSTALASPAERYDSLRMEDGGAGSGGGKEEAAPLPGFGPALTASGGASSRSRGRETDTARGGGVAGND